MTSLVVSALLLGFAAFGVIEAIRNRKDISAISDTVLSALITAIPLLALVVGHASIP